MLNTEQTASLGVFAGLNIDLPDPAKLPSQKDEWVVVLGGASSVGKTGIQVSCWFGAISIFRH